jgi:hypothetical protein
MQLNAHKCTRFEVFTGMTFHTEVVQVKISRSMAIRHHRFREKCMFLGKIGRHLPNCTAV